MDYGITRQEALALLHHHVKGENLRRHALASEAVMGALARHLQEDEGMWALAGLLHDLDVETQPDLAFHTTETAAILRGLGVHEDIIEAIRMHNEKAHGDRRALRFHHALAAGENITGLITATALVHPDKRLASVQPKSIVKRFKDKRFAAGADRAAIRECEHLGLDLEAFCAIGLEAMQGIAGDLGL